MKALIPALFLLPACAAAAQGMRLPPETARLNAMAARFAPVEIRVDLSGVPEDEQRALASLIRAARVTDPLFMRQRWAGSAALLLRLLDDESPAGRARLDYFLLNRGPWSELDEDEAFVPGVPGKPAGANYYPAGATKEEVEDWIEELDGEARARATGFFTTIRRDPGGSLMSVPYSVEYQGEVAQMAGHLREAAAATKQPTLKAFLESRADALVSNDYYESDVLWMKLDSSIEPTIGPYEVYEDEWFNYKAAFEAFITVRDEAETAKLGRFAGEMQWLEDRLPIDPRYRRARLGALAPMRVVNVVFAAGDGNHGVQTAAFNLPNDERIVAEMGSKRTMLRNFMQAKFEHVLVPISKRALAEEDQGHVSFDAFFTHVLMHEVMHGLGPTNTGPKGSGGGVRPALREHYSAIEEAKADISGLWALQKLTDKGVLDRDDERAMYTTFLASTFRTLRFGATEAHAKGMALQVNFLLDAGAFRVSPEGTFSVDLRRAKRAVADLTRKLLTIEATGDYEGAKRLLEGVGVLRPEVAAVIDGLDEVPVDIRPDFVTARTLEARYP